MDSVHCQHEHAVTSDAVGPGGILLWFTACPYCSARSNDWFATPAEAKAAFRAEFMVSPELRSRPWRMN